MISKITNTAIDAGTVLQTSGGFDISLDLILLIGIAAAVVLVLIWLFTQNQGAD